MKMSKSKGLAKFALGVGLGIGAGMLLAPKKGEELRKDLKDKINQLLEKVKEINVKEVSEEFVTRIKDLKEEIENLDREKVLSIAKEKSGLLKEKANELVELAKEKGTPVVEKAANEIKSKAIYVTKEVLRKLEKSNTPSEK